jgi:hypothetical protein
MILNRSNCIALPDVTCGCILRFLFCVQAFGNRRIVDDWANMSLTASSASDTAWPLALVSFLYVRKDISWQDHGE